MRLRAEEHEVERQRRKVTAKRRVLIAEDNPDAGATLHMLMSALGFEARLVADGEAVVREALLFVPDIVLLDIGMPRFSGYDAAQLLRLTDPGRKILIVAVSGWAAPKDIKLSMQAGIDAHIAKPIELSKLMAVIDEFFNSRKSSG
jgi:CheY-like chemotaxis protein